MKKEPIKRLKKIEVIILSKTGLRTETATMTLKCPEPITTSLPFGLALRNWLEVKNKEHPYLKLLDMKRSQRVFKVTTSYKGHSFIYYL